MTNLNYSDLPEKVAQHILSFILNKNEFTGILTAKAMITTRRLKTITEDAMTTMIQGWSVFSGDSAEVTDNCNDIESER